jgi:hypothetical protein
MEKMWNYGKKNNNFLFTSTFVSRICLSFVKFDIADEIVLNRGTMKTNPEINYHHKFCAQ